MQHNESSTLHTLTPSGELIKGLVKAVKVALNEKYEFFPRKIGALSDTFGHRATMAYYFPVGACSRPGALKGTEPSTVR